ncbi:Uncharacterized protein LSUE1_G005890 [Lachnellula suecica]|uniref:Fibronectin type-III domain-containing protein n=1 Tax=Lachnellula suecica TaxID=602035 RepID=A0A8T9C4E6_9HELO|nr:Uncharacterized protein LSUE1_G005890 [Lachnellula suecica]
MNALTYYSELADWVLDHVTDSNMFVLQSVVTCSALCWLLHRAWQTLWTPVPELISILGVEVPDAPAVSLAGITSDSVTLHWSRPGINKLILRYLIQVNGVNVGDSSRLDTAITVQGLKPGHFYNIRVIAVGSNNFQAGSRVIRLRTYGPDDRPQLGSGPVPPNLAIDEQNNSNELPVVRTHGVGIETATLPEGPPALQRESSNNQPGQRRNTGGRKHSPSSAAADHAALANASAKYPEESMQQLTEKFEGIRMETEEITSQMSKDAEEFKTQFSELSKERDVKKQELKEKEDASEKLKREGNSMDHANRRVQNRKTQKEKILQNKQAERAKMLDDIAKWSQETENMKAQREKWLKEKDEFLKAKAKEAKELRETIDEQTGSLGGLEEDIRDKGLQIKKLEEDRKHLPGGEDNEESRARDAADIERDAEWGNRERDLTAQLNDGTIYLRQLEWQQAEAQTKFNNLTISLSQGHPPLTFSSGIDSEFMAAANNRPRPRRSRNRKSRTNTISSPAPTYATTEFPTASTYGIFNTTSPSFAAGPYFDMSNDTAMVPLSEQMAGMSEADIKAITAGAPLSPTAHALLPSGIFDADDDPPSPRANSTRSFGEALYGNAGHAGFDYNPQSPSPSSRSASLMSSPQASSQNLAMYGVSGHDYANENDRRSLNSPRTEYGAIGSSSGPVSSPHRGFGHLFQFSKSRGKAAQQDGPTLGSLKQGQSQSFPRSTDDPAAEASIHRTRRTSLSGWGIFTRNQAVTDLTDGNGPAPARNLSRNNRRMMGGGSDDSTVRTNRDPSSPRPVSIGSSDLPRPSTDSSQFGWPAAEGVPTIRASPLAQANWSVSQSISQPWSRNPSRRPSIQHGSTTALTSGIASDDDEFLPSDPIAGQFSPGVIGTRPVSSHKPITPKLDPTAPTFIGSMFSFSSKKDKVKNGGKGKEKAIEKPSSSGDGASSLITTSPSESRKSRDGHSIHTQNSIAESHESLEMTYSNTPSDMTTPSTKEKDSTMKKFLTRKPSSSRFSLSSIRGKDSGLFSGKKGGSSTANSDRAERDSSLDEIGDDSLAGRNTDSVTSSPAIGSGEWSRGKEKDGAGNGTPKEGRRSVNWSRFGLKKGKARARAWMRLRQLQKMKLAERII